MQNLKYKMCGLLAAFFLVSCSDPTFRVHERLDDVLQRDLESMVAQIIKGSSKANVLDTPYFVIKDLREFSGSNAEIYSSYAEVEFFYFKDIKIAERRKFRYDARRHYWDRYFKELFYY